MIFIEKKQNRIFFEKPNNQRIKHYFPANSQLIPAVYNYLSKVPNYLN